jgi:5-methylcytosine-specific restriction protein A
MIDNLKFILDNYLDLKKEQKSDNHPLFQKLCVDSVDELIEFINDERYIVKGSVGVGVWSSVPWLAIFDRFITSSAQSGYYPVFLFKDDMSGFYLSLGIGVTSVQLEYKESKKIREALKNQNSLLLNKIKTMPSGFETSTALNFRLQSGNTKNKLASNYEEGCVIAKYYSAKKLPTDNELFIDVTNLLETYQQVIYDSITASTKETADELLEEFPSFVAETDLRKMRHHMRIERDDRKLIKEVKKRKGHVCECCEFDFEKVYGEIGKNYIEAHHKQPIHQLKGKVIKLDAEKDFIVLCSNCHKMIHRLDDPSDLEKLKQLFKSNL